MYSFRSRNAKVMDRFLNIWYLLGASYILSSLADTFGILAVLPIVRRINKSEDN